MKLDEPTLHLLNSSSLVGISGGLRLYLAYTLAGEVPRLPSVLAGSLIIYSTYTFDRSLHSTEDEINRPLQRGADSTMGFLASAVTFIVGLTWFLSEHIILPPLFPFLVGIVYSRGIGFGSWKIKLKGGAGVKNLVIGITWGGTIGLLVAATGRLRAALVLGIYFATKLVINSTIFDLRDVRGDSAAGIRTLPVCLRETELRFLLFTIFFIQNGVLFVGMFLEILVFAPIFLCSSFLAGFSVITFYHPALEHEHSWLKRHFRILTINGEPFIQSGLRIFLPY